VTQARLTEKPVAVIYNPTSGKKLNIRERIEAKLSEHGIEVRFYET
jgi:diacylglycerol kinase family enzyme